MCYLSWRARCGPRLCGEAHEGAGVHRTPRRRRGRLAAGGTHAGQIIMTMELDGGAPADFETENARLRRELREASERQAATDEVLRVISTLPRNPEPAFQAML